MLFQVQWVVVILLTCYTLAHATPKRKRSVPSRKLHAQQEPIEDSEHEGFGDLTASLAKWQGRGKKRRTAGTNLKVSVMARYLLEAWGFGVKSAHEVQREAAMAVADGADLPDLVKIAGLATAEHDEDVGHMRPMSPGDIERDLRRAVRIMTMSKFGPELYPLCVCSFFADHVYVPLHSCDTKLVSGQHEPWI